MKTTAKITASSGLKWLTTALRDWLKDKSRRREMKRTIIMFASIVAENIEEEIEGFTEGRIA